MDAVKESAKWYLRRIEEAIDNDSWRSAYVATTVLFKLVCLSAFREERNDVGTPVIKWPEN